MERRLPNLLRLPFWKSAFVLAVTFFSQVYPYYHSHGFQLEVSTGVDAAGHLAVFDKTNLADYSHDDDPHGDSHQHTYSDRHLGECIRFQVSRTLLNQICGCLPATTDVTQSDRTATPARPEHTLPSTEYYFTCRSLRGPPVVG